MLENKIFIDEVIVNKNKVSYIYTVTGSWKEAFNENEMFFIEYNIEIENVPKSILVIPLIANILPIAWLYDAEIIAPYCDKDFYESIDNFKNGYKNMYPMLVFRGALNIDKIENNNITVDNEGAAAFFSGGVDAFNTLVNHQAEKPSLITIWGADIHIEDKEGWERVFNHLKQTAKEFNTNYITVKTSFRKFINESVLTKKVEKSGDGWWHGFHHGIGIISHAAPIMNVLKKETVYIASSFTIAEKGKVTCASDPTIDNYVRFCGAKVVHDGYESNRQMKIHNITKYCDDSGRSISLRVCWRSNDGGNCCNCEKCWRTILGIYAEGHDPKDFGFEYDRIRLEILSMKMRYGNEQMFTKLRYEPIQHAMRKNMKQSDLPIQIRWFYGIDIERISKTSIIYKILHKLRKLICIG